MSSSTKTQYKRKRSFTAFVASQSCTQPISYRAASKKRARMSDRVALAAAQSRSQQQQQTTDECGQLVSHNVSCFSSQSQSQSQSPSLYYSCNYSGIIRKQSEHGPSSPHRRRTQMQMPSDIIMNILSYNTYVEWFNCCAFINKAFHQQCRLLWQRISQCEISPMHFPVLVNDYNRKTFDYKYLLSNHHSHRNRNDHEHDAKYFRSHCVLYAIIHKLFACKRLQSLTFNRTMIDATLFQNLIYRLPQLKHLHLSENPCILLKGSTMNGCTTIATAHNIDVHDIPRGRHSHAQAQILSACANNSVSSKNTHTANANSNSKNPNPNPHAISVLNNNNGTHCTDTDTDDTDVDVTETDVALNTNWNTTKQSQHSPHLQHLQARPRPTFQLESLVLSNMYPQFTDLSFKQLLCSSLTSLTRLIICRKDPFVCSNVRCQNIRSVCKRQKCEDCCITSYCNERCQEQDWMYHQFVCPSHDPTNELKNLHNTNHNTMNVNVQQLSGGILDTICLLERIQYLDLSWTYMIDDSALQRISEMCPDLMDVFLNGCGINDIGIIALAKNLSNLRTLHCRMSRFVTDESMVALCNHCWRTLVNIDITRNICISADAVFHLIQSCAQLHTIYFACGLKRGGFIWQISDEIANAIVHGLPKIRYISFMDGKHNLSCQVRHRLFHLHSDLLIVRIQTENEIEKRYDTNTGVESFVYRKKSTKRYPVLIQAIKNGKVLNSERFRR